MKNEEDIKITTARIWNTNEFANKRLIIHGKLQEE